MNSLSSSASFQDASGPLVFNMANDYLFRAVLQSNNKVLTGLICSLLHFKASAISSVAITNPIILGESINDKEFWLDINVSLADHSIINLEMQVTIKLNWPDHIMQ